MGFITSKKVMTTETIAASGTADSLVIDLTAFQSDGTISVQYELTGDGTAKIDWLQTSEGSTVKHATNFVLPSGGSRLATDITKTSGTGGDGKDTLELNTSVAKYLKLRATETGTSNSVILTLIFTTYTED